MAANAPFTPASPMGFWHTFGPRADPVTALNWSFSAISVAVVAIMTVLVVVGVLNRAQRHTGDMASVPVSRGAGGLGWIYIGMALTLVTLIGSLVGTVAVLAAVNSPAAKPALTLEVTGHQWWWEVTYLGGPEGTFTTANEIHIPVGRPVLVKLKGADVIHSFWAPALTGKTDVIPGRTNVTWLQADRAGIYRGQCTEYCGEQHAHMALYVSADPPAAFEAWRQDQLKAAPEPASAETLAGQQVFDTRCGACHTVRGGSAGGVVGPDLTHLMSRATLAAGTLPNTVATLSGWIENPQALKPGARMPPTDVPPPQLVALRAYLETLK